MNSIFDIVCKLFRTKSSLKKDDFVVLNPQESELCDFTKCKVYHASDVTNPLHPLSIKCGASMMCLTY